MAISKKTSSGLTALLLAAAMTGCSDMDSLEKQASLEDQAAVEHLERLTTFDLENGSVTLTPAGPGRAVVVGERDVLTTLDPRDCHLNGNPFEPSNTGLNTPGEGSTLFEFGSVEVTESNPVTVTCENMPSEIRVIFEERRS
ncbi:hypothetical protein FYJ24_08915 [Actinomycetaceae bacterium WB03_NA08]|uniref:Lipoprotein n=2 Tax=Scrofimicrobium canadense TaxID=2652290 RepID=A0A6N7W8X8_9ACTO|nr:hypothetical protein [Scrofimicrobium canadense]